ncbi:MAG: glycoside hydrolase family 2 [Clostridia bacterium]|nr:glycoside hydrolase family 2 [Clostridia bacterium]
MKKERQIHLLTADGERLEREGRAQLYPRPHLERDSFFSLDGIWELEIRDRRGHVTSKQIRVPFVPQSRLSGIQSEVPQGATLTYKRQFSLPQGFCKGGRVLLHIGAADRFCGVYLNGASLGGNDGGYGELCLDVTAHLKEENKIEVWVLDNGCTDYPYGKQRKKRGGMWYTPVCGIWQSVWMECVPERYVEEIEIKTQGDVASLFAKIAGDGSKTGSVTLHLEGGDTDFPLTDGCAEIAVPSPVYWSPEHPQLYRITLRVGEDTVRSYFALRTLEIKKVGGFKRLCLNGKPYFFHGLLDQGYFSDGIFTPAQPSGYEQDILAAKRLGFNMLRKHIKVEPERFYYDCDRLGMVVFQDMVNNGSYSFVRDTALPTLGFKRRNDKRMHRDPYARACFLQSMEQTVRRLSFHPSVCYWTIFNEGWGQFDHAAAYDALRALDDTRFIDSVSGWFLPPRGEAKSDVESPHVYFKEIRLQAGEKPLVLSEFGGYSYKVEGHCFNLDKAYGYRSFKAREDFETALLALYREQVLPHIGKGLCAAVYTQLTDVEDEINGLLTYDRRVVKVSEQSMQALAAELKSAIE